MTTLTKEEDIARRPATMKDVAALADVSIKTVSRVINQEAGVTSELTDRVMHAVGMLGYQHNTAASNLRRADQRTATIGLLLDDVANPFSSALYRAIEDVARQHDTLVFAGSSDEDPSREEKLVLTLASRRVDGLIVVPTSRNSSGFMHIQRLDRPIVFVDRPAIFHDADSIMVDNRVGSSRAIGHMAGYGHRSIAFLGDTEVLQTSAERYLGYIEGLATAGIQLNQRLVRKNLRGIEAAERAMLDLLDEPQPPTAIFASQNLTTIGAIRALQSRGLQHRIAIVGFDDFLLADLLDPRVSVIAQQPATLGRMAAELLFARLNGDRSPAQHIVVPTQLIPRGSGEIAAVVP